MRIFQTNLHPNYNTVQLSSVVILSLVNLRLKKVYVSRQRLNHQHPQLLAFFSSSSSVDILTNRNFFDVITPCGLKQNFFYASVDASRMKSRHREAMKFDFGPDNSPTTVSRGRKNTHDKWNLFVSMRQFFSSYDVVRTLKHLIESETREFKAPRRLYFFH